MLKTGAKFDRKFGWIFNDFLMDFWIDFGVILDVFWDEKSIHFFDRFLDVLFLRLGNAALLQRDFSATSAGALTAPRRRLYRANWEI